MFWGIPGNAHQRSLKASEEKRQKPMSNQYMICHEAVWLVVRGGDTGGKYCEYRAGE